MRTLGILAFGSLIEDSGKEITPRIVCRLDVRTPFSVEFARYSRTRGGAPTLTPVNSGGAPVKAQLLVLEDTTTLSDAIDMLWRRETRNECTGRRYPASRSPRAVRVKQIHKFQGVDTVLYTDFYAKGKILYPKPKNLARRAIKSVAVASSGRDGISYLISAKAAGIVTPLMKEYEIEV